MGYDLEGKGGYFRWNGLAWHHVLDLGQLYGWEPAGTGPPRGTLVAEWTGYYASNDGQLFKAWDAKHLADALEAALADFPHYRRAEDSDPYGAWAYLSSAEGKEYLQRFIHFLRSGSFRLY